MRRFEDDSQLEDEVEEGDDFWEDAEEEDEGEHFAPDIHHSNSVSLQRMSESPVNHSDHRAEDPGGY